MQPKVSIIVPVYCVEKYLHACVDSLLAQTLEDIEIILVDDGSPDQSGKIADEYAEKDSRIKVIHQSNAGLGPARNTGMEAATGEYIGFVDSDDWVKPDMFVRLYQEAVRNDADIVVGGYQEVKDGITTKCYVHPLSGMVLDHREDILRIRKNLYAYGTENKTREVFPVTACASVYRREIIQSLGLRFQNILSEDRIFNLDAYREAQKMVFIDSVDYCYRKDGQVSITQTFSEKTIQKYKNLLTIVAAKACEEQDRDCRIRVKRMVIDYCRAYVELVGKSNAPAGQKVTYLRALLGREEVRRLWHEYPVKTLPFMQRILHWTIEKEWYLITLALNDLRRRLL